MTWLVTVPVAAVWLVVLLDILTRGDMSVLVKAAWIAVTALMWPTMIAYLLLRPVEGRIAGTAGVRRAGRDPRRELVTAVLGHGAGMVAEDDFRRRTERLRGISDR